jgi:hypothetical protein
MILSEHLMDEFLKAMDDIGKYGLAKHGENSFQAHRLRGSHDRGESARLSAKGMAGHAQYHFDAYLAGTLHDHFGSLRHQLAAVAFNAMMEFYFAGLDTERSDEIMRAVKG